MLDFPASPTNGQTFQGWTWDGTAWVATAGGGGGSSVTVSDAPPAAPKAGDLWWDSVGGQLYVWFADPDTSQWVIANSGGGGAYLPSTGGTLSGGLTVAPATGNANLVLDKPTFGTDACSIVGRAQATLRWQIQPGNGSPESGGNTGSDFGVYRYDDAGAYLGATLTIERVTGDATFARALTVGGNLVLSGGRDSSNLNMNGGWLLFDPTTSYWSLTNLGQSGYGGVYVGTIYNIGEYSGPGDGWGPAAVLRCGGGAPHSLSFEWPGAALYFHLDHQPGMQIATVSDHRTKKDIAPLDESMWAKVQALRPVRYTQADYGPFKADDQERWGLLAHELQETLIPTAADGVKDDPNIIQSPNSMTVIAVLIKALQEAMTRIEALEAGR